VDLYENLFARLSGLPAGDAGLFTDDKWLREEPAVREPSAK
jgi:hypothetical protein